MRIVTEKANTIENALAHSTRVETLVGLLEELQHDLQMYKHIILQGGDGENTLAQLEHRARTLSRRVNIIKMSYESDTTRTKLRDQPDSDCHLTRNTDKLNKYIKIASHSLNSIEKQKSILKGSRKKLEDGLQYLGVSDRVIDQISNRYLTDYRLFKALTAIFILLFIYVFIIRG